MMTISPSSDDLREQFLELKRLRKKIEELERRSAKVEAAKRTRPTPTRVVLRSVRLSDQTIRQLSFLTLVVRLPMRLSSSAGPSLRRHLGIAIFGMNFRIGSTSVPLKLYQAALQLSLFQHPFSLKEYCGFLRAKSKAHQRTFFLRSLFFTSPPTYLRNSIVFGSLRRFPRAPLALRAGASTIAVAPFCPHALCRTIMDRKLETSSRNLGSRKFAPLTHRVEGPRCKRRWKADYFLRDGSDLRKSRGAIASRKPSLGTIVVAR